MDFFSLSFTYSVICIKTSSNDLMRLVYLGHWQDGRETQPFVLYFSWEAHSLQHYVISLSCSIPS